MCSTFDRFILDIYISQARGASFFSDPMFQEEFRTINIRLRVVRTDPDSRFPHRPKLTIAGTINGIRHMRGVVSMTPDKQVRWQYVSSCPLKLN